MMSFLLLTAGIQFQASASPLRTATGSINTNARFGPPVKGKVTSATGEAMIGVNVMVKATKKGTSTNEKGEFTINASPDDILVITYVGYETQEVKVGNNTTLNIVLTSGATQLA
ncbi:carboxypeptidase-like regulatory domain-containing protein, partial [Chitinophaga sp.]|uniref:carboxypeptidase-like regulatory domain-containing protein n=1 Tax=Chitinophaga sp. TaxID=1869181 RepID=UPI0031D26282